MITIKTLRFNDYEDLAMRLADDYDEMKETGCSDDFVPSVTLIAKYDDAKAVISELVGMGYPLYSVTEFASPDFNDYSDEYVVSIYDDELWVEPMRRKDGYISEEAYICYVMGDCNSTVLREISTPIRYEVQIEDSCNGDCDKCTWDDGEDVEAVDLLNVIEALNELLRKLSVRS